MSLDRRTAVDILLNRPVAFGRAVGFTKLGDLHNRWIISMVCGIGDRTLQAHRGSYKTTCVAIALAIIILLFPNDRSSFMRKTDNDVKEVVTQTRKILEHALTQEFVRVIWGVSLRLTKATSTEIHTNLTNDPRGTEQLVGIGMGGSLTGKHFDRIFTDDIVNVQDRVSKAERERTKLIYQELQNIRIRGGRIINTGTPWHEGDAFSIMPNPERYDCYSTGLISVGELAKIRESMLASLFAANYELRHIAAEDVIFTNPQTGADPAKIQGADLCHLDAAYGGGDGTAFSVCKKRDGKYYVLGKLWQKHVDACIPEIIRLRQAFQAETIYCESNADKGYLARDLRECGQNVITYHESTNKFLKIASYLKGVWKDVVFVEGTDMAYIKQICDYTEEAEHDDAPDSLASAVRILRPRKEQSLRRNWV